jgi:putative PIN family toxin of toxin-antitoxin system
MKAVLDTNIYVSALLKPAGQAGQILERWRDGTFDLVLSEAILTELADVYTRARFRRVVARSPAWLTTLVTDLRQIAVLVEPAPVQAVPDDPDDDVIVGTALAAAAAAIVTGDAHLLALRGYRGIAILTPRSFLEMLTTAS